MKRRFSIKPNKIASGVVACCLCATVFASTGMASFLPAKAEGMTDMGFNWENGLSEKLDAYSTRYNGNLGIENGGDTFVKNADGGLPNAALTGNGHVGALLGGSSEGQSVVVGLNDFWKGQYNYDKFEGNMAPLSFGSFGYDILSDENVGNTDIDLATTYADVTASSQADEHPATCAVGGDYVSNNFWGIGWWSGPGSGKNSWLQLEFDKPINFSRVAVWSDGSTRLDADLNIEENGTKNAWENDTVHEFEIQTSNDGEIWTTVHSETGNYLPIYDRDLETSASGKYVRLFVKEPRVDHKDGAAKVVKFSLYENKKNDKNMLPSLVNGTGNIYVSSNTVPDRIGQDAAHIYTTSTVYATACGVQQHLSGYGSVGYGWFTDPEPAGDYIIYKLNKPTTFKSYQLWNGSASAPGSNNHGDWRGWTVETSTDGNNFKEVHRVDNPTDPGDPTWAGQPAINSYDIPAESLANTADVEYIKVTCLSAFGGRGILSQFKIFADTLANSGIDVTNETTFIQNIKEGQIGVESKYRGQEYEAMTTVSQNGTSSFATKITNKSDKPLDMRFYTSARLFNEPTYTQNAGVTEDNKTLYATRTTVNGAPSNLAWVAAGTMAASIDGGAAWKNAGNTRGQAYGDFTIPANSSVIVNTYVDAKMFMEDYENFHQINAVNTPTQEVAVKASQAADGEKVFTETADWWKSYWEKSGVELYNKTTEEYFYTASYIVGCSARVGSAPSSLFGPFVSSDNVSWGGTYVTDYNLYGTYMAVAGMNREELLLPLVVNALESWGGIKGVGNGIGSRMGDAFNAATNNNFRNSDGSMMFKNGVDGILSAVVSGPHGYALNTAGFDRILFTCAYAAIPVIQYYDMTQGTGEIYDDLILDDELLYNYLKDLMKLWEQILVYENGVYKVKYDAAWEYEQNNMGNAFSIAAVHMFTQKLSKLAEKLGYTASTEPRIAKWKHIDQNLEAYPTTMADYDSDGKFELCYSDTLTTAQKGNITYNGRANSNPNVAVAQVIPTDQLGLYSDPAEKEIMRNSLQNLQSWYNINAMPTIFSTAARTGYASHKYGNDSDNKLGSGCTDLVQMIASVTGSGMKQNNLSKLCDPLQLIDTCGGVQGINDILIQNYKDIITLFPAYPDDQAGRFFNLQVVGGYLVSAEQDANGVITYAKIESQYGGRITLALPAGADWDIVDADGKPVTVTRSNVGAIVGFDAYKDIQTITFDTTANMSYYKVNR